MDEATLALINGTQFRDGTIEVDIATKVNAPPGVRRPGFTGIAFRVGADAGHYELFYLRPGNSSAEDQAMRNHAVQYVSAPDFGWEKLRRVAIHLRILGRSAIGRVDEGEDRRAWPPGPAVREWL